MRKIVLENYKFDFDLGCRLLKLKYGNDCPFPELEDFWNDIVPCTFKEIAKFENLEERRVGVFCLGLERLIKEVNPKLLNKETIKKTTTWINSKGELETKEFDDTYELFEVSEKYFNEGFKSWQKFEDSYFVKCKDTSTDREYMIWVELRDIASIKLNSNDNYIYFDSEGKWKKSINSIQAIAWTIQTNVEKGNIEKIIRQGDCILIKPKNKSLESVPTRHLTEEEYRTLLVAES